MVPPSFEIDLIELTVGCAEQCSHCSEDPQAGVRHAEVGGLLAAVRALVRLETLLQEELFGHYWYPFPASDPFSHPELLDLCDGIWNQRSLPVYLLSLGWNRRIGSEAARHLCQRPASLFRIAITVSNFSKLARLNPTKHRSRLAASLADLRSLWSAAGPDGKPLVLLSPQFVHGLPAAHPFSEEHTQSLLEDVCEEVQLPLGTWVAEHRIFPRPVTGLGRALTVLNVTADCDYPVTAETPCPPISKHPERPFSGLIAWDGTLAVLASRRGLLGRTRSEWVTLLNRQGQGEDLAFGREVKSLPLHA